MKYLIKNKFYTYILMSKVIYIFEAVYLIYMYNYFKTSFYIHHPLELVIQKINPFNWFRHPISQEEMSNKICPFGNLMGFVLAGWIIYVTFNPILSILKFNKIVWMATAIISLTSNMNAFVYIIPCLIIEYLRYC
tara:strand:- start:856 stop:1260 length:405 start_codon:yes stop_codon:yes gene_type:complete